MDIVIDTCIYLRNDFDQSNTKGFNYKKLEKILNDNVDNIYLTPFSLSEIFVKRKYDKIEDLINNIKSNNIKILDYDIPEFTILSKDIVNKYFEIMYYHLTEFLYFFITQIIMNCVKKDCELVFDVIKNELEKYYDENGPINFNNITVFMKHNSIDCIECTISNILKYFDIKFDDKKKIWKVISDSKIDMCLFDNNDINYINYSNYLIYLFGEKFKNKANKIELQFGFIDLMVAYANRNNYIVISKDKGITQYLLKYGSNENRDVIKKLWDEKTFKKIDTNNYFQNLY